MALANVTKINNLYPIIGQHDGRKILRWDPATRCSDDCCIRDDCPYVKAKKCTLELTYMNGIFNNLIDPTNVGGIADQMNDIELQRVGIHLIPLYHQLIRMKKEAYAVKEMTHVNKQGSIKVNPVFAEIREIIRCIAKEMSDLKINEKWEAKYGKTSLMVDAGASIEELLQHGDPSFTDSLSGK